MKKTIKIISLLTLLLPGISLAQAPCQNPIFVEQNGLVVVEAESAAQLGNGWKIENAYAEAALGGAYIVYKGGNYLHQVPASTITTYKIKISTPGKYQFKWRSRNGQGAIASDQENDSWLNIEADEFYGEAGGKVVIGANYAKLWVHSMDQWSWEGKGEYEEANGLRLFAQFNQAGTYTVNIAGRSNGHPVDRFALFLKEQSTAAVNDATIPSSIDCGKGVETKEWADSLGLSMGYASGFVIDGELDTLWESVETHKVAYDVLNQGVPANTDLSATYRLAFDTGYVYIFAEVKDQQVLVSEGDKDTEVAYDDHILVGFNPDGKHETGGALGEDAVTLRFGYGREDTQWIGLGAWKSDATVMYRSKVITGGYTMEIQIPWSGILGEGEKPVAGSLMGFELEVVDQDGQGAANNHLAWANNTKVNAGHNDTRKWGYMTLLEIPEKEIIQSVENHLSTQLLVYPNPMLNQEFQLRTENTQPLQLTLVDLNGKVIWERSIQGQRQYLLKPEVPMAAGVYLLQVRNRQGATAVHRLLVD
ncbi:sugar-binding protein [Algivirga pacifica]|uniref:Carbohydrate-binding domain-containing protein n=1 Tax=Algivirga pacifica TaxID=1162670 RepID=A0ABP9D8D0_9BACT